MTPARRRTRRFSTGSRRRPDQAGGFTRLDAAAPLGNSGGRSMGQPSCSRDELPFGPGVGDDDPVELTTRPTDRPLTLVATPRHAASLSSMVAGTPAHTSSQHHASPSPKVPKSQVTRIPHAARRLGLVYIDGLIQGRKAWRNFDAPDCFLRAKDTRSRCDMPRIAEVAGGSDLSTN
jgi:hypothetical protein